jgi:hypothetical protein
MIPVKRDLVAEAQERLDVARKELEATRLNKEAEQLYSKLYDDVLQEDETQESNEKKL